MPRALKKSKIGVWLEWAITWKRALIISETPNRNEIVIRKAKCRDKNFKGTTKLFKCFIKMQ